MNEYTQSLDGYIVFDDGGTSPIAYGAAEKWFSTYDEAIEYAMGIVKRRVGQLKNRIDYNSVIIYKGSEALMNKSHSCPAGQVLFNWTNYKR